MVTPASNSTMATTSPSAISGGVPSVAVIKCPSPSQSPSFPCSPFSQSSSSSSSPSPLLKPVDFVYHSWCHSADHNAAPNTTNACSSSNKSIDHLTRHRNQALRTPLIISNRYSCGNDVKSATPMAKIAFLTSTPQPSRDYKHSLFDRHRVFSPPVMFGDKFDWPGSSDTFSNQNRLKVSSTSSLYHPPILQAVSLPNGPSEVTDVSEDKEEQIEASVKPQTEREDSIEAINFKIKTLETEIENLSSDPPVQSQKELEKGTFPSDELSKDESLLEDSKLKDRVPFGTGNTTFTRLISTPAPPVSRLIQQRHKQLMKNTKQSNSSPLLINKANGALATEVEDKKKERRRHLTDEDVIDRPDEGTHDSTKSIPEMMTSQGKNFKKNKSGIRRLFMPIRRSQSTGNGNDGLDGIDKLGRQKYDHELADVILSPDIKKKSLRSDIKSKIHVLTKRYTNINLLPCEKQVVPSIKLWARSIEDLLADKTGLECFRQFLKSEFSEENLRFWLACEELKKMKPNQIPSQSQKIFYEFIAHKAPHEVNIDARTRDITCNNMNSPDQNTFDEAQKRIQALMERDSYLRFIESDFYQNLLKIKFN